MSLGLLSGLGLWLGVGPVDGGSANCMGRAFGVGVGYMGRVAWGLRVEWGHSVGVGSVAGVAPGQGIQVLGEGEGTSPLFFLILVPFLHLLPSPLSPPRSRPWS